MRDFSPKISVLLCALALLFALSAQAAPRERAHATPPSTAVAGWLDAVWNGLARLFASVVASPPAAKGNETVPIRPLAGHDLDHGGSCIDPDGCPCS